jgi:DNA helicase TIP49 (TBP-interacting protein)
MSIRLKALKDGREVPLPPGIENLVIETSQGGIYIQLEERVTDMVLARAVKTDEMGGEARLILSPMDSGRVAIGVIRT